MKSIRTQDEGVSKVRKKITALTVVFSLIIAMFAGGLQTFAAGADDISITGLVSDSATAQKFRIDNQTNRQIEVQWQTEEYNTGWTPVTVSYTHLSRLRRHGSENGDYRGKRLDFHDQSGRRRLLAQGNQRGNRQ